jgi:RND family efflux transporter MFP subunit
MTTMNTTISNTPRRDVQMKARFLLPGLALLLLTTACKEAPAPEAPAARPVKLLTIGGTQSGGELEYPGMVGAAKEAEVAFEVAGRITKLPVEEGDKVKKGAVLARLDARDYQSAVDAANADLNAARAEHERLKALFARSAVSRQELDTARRNKEVAETSVQRARKALEEARLVAPFAGTVAKKFVDEFQNVQAKQPVVLLQDDSGLEIRIAVPEGDLGRVKPGLDPKDASAKAKPMVEVSSFPGRKFPATMKSFSTTADPATRTFSAAFSFEKPDDIVIRPGMTARLTATLPDAGGVEAVGSVLIPSVAIRDDGAGSFVWVVDDAMAVAPRSVEMGELVGDQVKIVGGLDAGDVIVTSGVQQLREGVTVRRFED